MGSLPWKLAVAIPALTGGLCCILAVKAHVKVRPAVPSLSALPPSRRHPAVGCAPAQPNNNRITAVQVGEVAHPVVERVDAFVEQETGVSLKLLDKQACLDALYEKMPKDRYGDVDQDELQVNFRPSFTAYAVCLCNMGCSSVSATLTRHLDCTCFLRSWRCGSSTVY